MRADPRPLRIAVAIGAAVGLGLTGVAAIPASAARWDLQARIDAAPAGSTLHLPAGALTGGVTISKSLTLVGAGAGRTVVEGGDSVVRVTSPGAQPPTVTLADLTLTGGVARGDDVEAYGGGLLVAPTANGSTGAAVTLRDVVVTGNRATPRRTSSSPSGVACPGGVDCPYAKGAGGGIASFGDLVLDRTTVRGNVAGGRVSDADGGGVDAEAGTLTVVGSTIGGNVATSTGIGRFAEGGGIFSEVPTVQIVSTRVVGNSAVLRTAFPVFASGDADGPIDMNANAGGIHIGDGASAVVDRATISGNRVVADDPAGEPYAFSSGLFVGESTVSIDRTTVCGNALSARVRTSADVGYSGNAVELDGGGRITASSITGNRVDVSSAGGDAQAANGLGVFVFDGPGDQVTAKDVLISENTVTARSGSGSAEVFGAGVLNDGLLDLSGVVVRNDHGVAIAPDASAQGGGVYNGSLLGAPTVRLRVDRSTITGDSVVARGGTARGGGVYNAGGDGVTFSLAPSTRVAGNAPDQVYDAAAAAAQPRAQRLRISPRRAAMSR